MASASNVGVNQPLTLVLVGRTGNGKSSTGNSILGRNAFRARGSVGSTTKECKMEQCTREDGRVLNVIDTPGVFDTNVPREDVDREIVKCINLAERGIHAVLFVVSLRSRFTDEEAESIFMLQLLFGSEILNYMMIVFTGGDELEIPLQDHLEDCPVNLKRTVNLCNSRMVVFNNHISASANVKETQITELLEQVDIIVADKGGRPYSNDLFLKAQEMSSQLYHVKDKEKQNKEQTNAWAIQAEYEKALEQYKEQYERELTKLVNETMKMNALAMQEMLNALTKAESVSIIEKQSSKALEQYKEQNKAKMKESRGHIAHIVAHAAHIAHIAAHAVQIAAVLGGSCIIM